MTAKTLIEQLHEHQIVAMAASEWAALADEFETIESHDTCLAGELRIVLTSEGLAAVEEPKPDRRVIRHLGDEEAVRTFVRERLEIYDRMWDGCGCKVDYYG